MYRLNGFNLLSKNQNTIRFKILLNKLNNLICSKKSLNPGQFVIYINLEDMKLLRLQLENQSNDLYIYGIPIKAANVDDPVLKEIKITTNAIQ
jgi:hypothetical protein